MKTIYTILFCAILLTIFGCSTYIPISYPDNSLNIYNTYWDNFAGIIEKGKIYYYSNKGFKPELQLKVFQILSKNEILVIRNFASGQANKYAEYGKICESVIFLILSNQLYADGAKLRDGEYICVGTYTYETKNETSKTVYAFMDKEYYDIKRKEYISKTISIKTTQDKNNSAKIDSIYAEKLVETLYQLWNPPSNLLLNGRKPEVLVKIIFNQYGKVLESKIIKKSGFLPMDNSIEELLKNLSQVPVPPSGEATEVELIFVLQE